MANGLEGQTLARFDHPNIVPVFGEQIDGDRKLLAMRYIPGCTLAQWLTQLEGVVHRDVKPANLLIDPAGQALLMDFNVACCGGDDDKFDGTLAYMAPEHLAAFDVHLEDFSSHDGWVCCVVIDSERLYTEGVTFQSPGSSRATRPANAWMLTASLVLPPMRLFFFVHTFQQSAQCS